jgi:hypothetical protein
MQEKKCGHSENEYLEEKKKVNSCMNHTAILLIYDYKISA